MPGVTRLNKPTRLVSVRSSFRLRHGCCSPDRLAGMLVFLTLVFAPLIFGPAFAADPVGTATEADDSLSTSANVVIDGDVLFRVRGIPAFPADERAAKVAERITALAKDDAVDPGDGQFVLENERVIITIAGTQILQLVPEDALLEDVNLPILGEVVLGRIQEAIAKYRADRTPEALGRSADCVCRDQYRSPVTGVSPLSGCIAGHIALSTGELKRSWRSWSRFPHQNHRRWPDVALAGRHARRAAPASRLSL